MSNKMTSLILILVVLTALSVIVIAEEELSMVFGEHENLEKEQMMLWEVYGMNTELIKSIDIATINASPAEAVKILNEMIKQQGAELSEVSPKKANLGDTIGNTISLVGDEFVEVFGEEWVDKAPKYHLIRIFKKETGKTPFRYLQYIRILKAKEMLKNSDKCITDICFEVGFNNRCYFSSTFKEKVGIAPSEFRKFYKTLNNIPIIY